MKRSTTITAVAAASALLLPACGAVDSGDPGASTTTSSGASAEENEETEGGEDAASDVSVGDTVSVKEVVDRTGSAARDAGTVKAVASYGGHEMTLLTTYTDDGAANHAMTTGSGDQEMRFVTVDGVTYLSGPAYAGLLKGKKFGKIDPETATGDFAEIMQGTTAMGTSSADPFSLLESVPDVEAEVAKVKDGTVSYRIELDAAQTDKVFDEIASAAGQDGSKATPRAMTFTLDVGEDDLLERAVMDVKDSDTITTTFSDWGSAPEVTAPPAKDVTDIGAGG